MEINKEKILKNINSIIAVILIIVFFLPMFKLNSQELGYVNNLTASGWDAFAGIIFTDGSMMDISVAAILLLLFPLVLVLSNVIRQLDKIKKYVIYIVPVGSIIALFITKMSVDSKMNTSVSTSIGFWIYLLLSIALLILTFFQFKNISLNETEIKNFVKESSAKFVDASQEMFSITCPNCGSKVTKGKKFCAKCGTEMPKIDKEVKNKCAKCGAMVESNIKFCPECGEKIPQQEKKPVELICRNCGKKIKGENKFCPECGTKTSEE